MKADFTQLDGTTVRDQRVALSDILSFLQKPEAAIAHVKSNGVEVLVYKDAGFGVTVGVETESQEMAFREFTVQDQALKYMVLSLASSPR
jgi:hypothetical protein